MATLSNCPLHLAIEFLDQHNSQLVNKVHPFLLQNDGTLDSLSVMHVQNAEGGTESEVHTSGMTKFIVQRLCGK